MLDSQTFYQSTSKEQRLKWSWMYHQELGSLLPRRIWYYFSHLKICRKTAIIRQTTRRTSNEVQEVQAVSIFLQCVSQSGPPPRKRSWAPVALGAVGESYRHLDEWWCLHSLDFTKSSKYKTVRSSFIPQQSTRRHQKTLPRRAEHVSLVFIAAQVRDDRTMHEAKAVVHGEKMAANVWLGMWCKKQNQTNQLPSTSTQKVLGCARWFGFLFFLWRMKWTICLFPQWFMLHGSSLSRLTNLCRCWLDLDRPRFLLLELRWIHLFSFETPNLWGCAGGLR